MKHIKNFSELFESIGNYRDKKHFRGADVKYPDNIFGDIKTESGAYVGINFYKKVIKLFNKIFDRNLEITVSEVINDPINFKVVIRTERGLEPEYFAYATGKMGEHVIQKYLDKYIPGTSLRHELLHEAILPNIIEKFDLINHLDGSADLGDIDKVQRARAFNYTLEDVFYERVVEYLERLPDFEDTFPMSDYGKDVVARVESEMDGELTKENVLKTLKDILDLEGAECFLPNSLMSIFNKQNYESVDSLEDIQEEIGKQFELHFNIKKNTFSKDLQFKLHKFTEYFNDEYYGAIKKLKNK